MSPKYPNDALPDLSADTVIAKIDKLGRRNTTLGSSLEKLDTDTGFTGSYHCEALLIAFLKYRTEGNLSGISVGISKRCCPVCTKLLEILDPADPVAISSSHKVVYACSLPPWIPEDRADIVIQHFVRELKETLSMMFKTNSDELEGRQSADTMIASPVSSLGDHEPPNVIYRIPKISRRRKSCSTKHK